MSKNTHVGRIISGQPDRNRKGYTAYLVASGRNQLILLVPNSKDHRLIPGDQLSVDLNEKEEWGCVINVNRCGSQVGFFTLQRDNIKIQPSRVDASKRKRLKQRTHRRPFFAR
jgi:hypothetical protein